MATATLSHTEHIKRFEGKLNEVKQALASLPGDNFFNEINIIIHRPGWTTIAEGLFFENAVDAITVQTQRLAEMQNQLLAVSEAVGRG
jgi:hypothetical protein